MPSVCADCRAITSGSPTQYTEYLKLDKLLKSLIVKQKQQGYLPHQTFFFFWNKTYMRGEVSLEAPWITAFATAYHWKSN